MPVFDAVAQPTVAEVTGRRRSARGARQDARCTLATSIQITGVDQTNGGRSTRNRLPAGETRRKKKKRSTIVRERTREGHRQSDRQCNCFTGIVWETSETAWSPKTAFSFFNSFFLFFFFLFSLFVCLFLLLLLLLLLFLLLLLPDITALVDWA